MQRTSPSRAVLSALLLLAACRPTIAAIHVVASTGDDAHPGTEAQPWKTLAKAAASVESGDVVRIRAGEYFVGPTWRVSHAGTAENPITYQAFGDGEVRISNATLLPANGWTHVKDSIYSIPVSPPVYGVFHGAMPLHGPANRVPAEPVKFIVSVETMIPGSFYVGEKSLYVWLEDGSHPKDSVIRMAPGHTISLYDCHHSTFDGLTVEFGFNGIKDQGKATHDITIRNRVIRSIASQGIQPVPKDCIIERNLFQKIGSTKFEHGIYCSQSGTIIRNNIFEEIAGAAIHQFPAGGNCQFYGNTFRMPRKMMVRSAKEAYYLDIVAWGEGHHHIYNNVFFGEGKRGGISLNSIDNKVYHNTFVDSSYGIEFHSGKPDNAVINNIVQNASRSFVIWPANALPQTLDYNLYFNSTAVPRWERDGLAYKSFDAYRQAAGETHSQYADPKLAGPGDACLRPGSPAIDAASLLKDVDSDFAGVKRPQGATSGIGAYEHKPNQRE